jgi:hypothetical protein
MNRSTAEDEIGGKPTASIKERFGLTAETPEYRETIEL